jgi:hypothetical protein
MTHSKERVEGQGGSTRAVECERMGQQWARNHHSLCPNQQTERRSLFPSPPFNSSSFFNPRGWGELYLIR